MQSFDTFTTTVFATLLVLTVGCNGGPPDEPEDTGSDGGDTSTRDAGVDTGPADTGSADTADTVAADTTPDVGDATDASDATDTLDPTDTADAGDPPDVRDAGDVDDASDTADATPPQHVFQWDFDNGAQTWEASFADYGDSQKDGINFESGVRPLPDELNNHGKGFFLAGTNTPDDLFMFLKRSIGGGSSLEPNTKYRLDWRVTFASNAPSGCVGIGGAPGEAVHMKVGGSTTEPRAVEAPDGATQDVVMNVDQGGNSTSGRAATVTDNIANGIACEEHDGEYVRLVHEQKHANPVETDENGKLWLLTGTDSGFEGRTALYYMNIKVTLTRVE